MKKLVVRFLMLLFVLGMSTNAAWGSMDGMAPYYVAELTAKVSSTGGGKVYVAKDQNPPAEEAYATISTQHGGRPAYMPGVAMAQVPFVAWQTASDGYYFVGWSFSDNGFDLGKFNPGYPQTEVYGAYANLYDVSSEKSTFKVTDDGDGDETNDAPVLDENGEYQYIIYNPAKYTLYATFEPVRIAKYTLSGNNTNAQNGDNYESTQTVTYTFSGEEIDDDDFESLAFAPEAAGWTVSGLTVVPEKKTGTATVTFSTLDDQAQEYSANLRLTTKAGITMDILLSARTRAASTGEEKDFALYDGKVYKDEVNFADLAAKISEYACAKPLIKLNNDYSSALTISQDLSLDLCGHNLTSLSVSEGATVTLVSSPYGGSITGNVTNNGTLTLMGNKIEGAVTNNGTLYQNGATVKGAITNNGTMTTTDGVHLATLTSEGTLTINGGVFTPASGVAIDVIGGTADIKKGTIEGKTYGVQSAGTTTIEKLAVISGVTEKALKKTGGELTVNCGKFTDPAKLADGEITFKSAYFQTNTNNDDKIDGKKIWRNTSGAEYRDGYKFFAGDYSEAKKAGVSVCHIGGTSYSSLEAALDYANNAPDKEHKAIIIMDNDYSLPAGYYTLPANAVLIVPKDNDQGNENKTVERVTMADDDNSNWLKPERFRTLTLLAGVTLDVYGTIEVTGSQFSTNAAYTSAVYGPYGCIQMNEGSKMNLQNGSELRAWGYITGDIDYQDNDHNVPMGEIDARRGATVREQFQMGDWKGAVFSGLGLLGGGGAPEVFPLTTYFIQNIEVPVKYHPGSKLSTTASVAASANEHPTLGSIMQNILKVNCLTMSANDIQIIGVNGKDIAMFLMEEAADADNTWVRKWYDASKDQQVYEINSGAHIGNLVIPLVSSPMFKTADPRFPDQLNMNSGQYDLPITNNFKLHLLSGTMDFTQSTELLPGAELEIDKEARVYITKTEGVNSGALYVYDAEDWGTFAGGVPARHVKYSPVFEGYNEAAEPDVRGIELENLEDASIFVHGTFDITDGGCVYTSAGGANIHSTNEDAGTLAFYASNIYKTVEIVDDEEQEVEHPTVQLKQVSTSDGGGVQEQTFSPAVLQNGDGSDPKETAEIEAGQAILYMNDRWQSAPNLIHFDCYTAEVAWDTYQEEITKLALVSAPDNIAEYMVGSQIAAQMFGDTPTPEFYEQAKNMDYYDEKCQCNYKTTFASLKTSQIDPYIANAKTEGYDLGKAVQAIYIKPQEWLEITGKAALPLEAETIAGFGVLYETDPNNAVNSYMDYISGLANTPMLIGNDDHTFSDADGAGRLFILVTGKNGDECQWWEVEKKDNLYHCTNPENDTYYFWDPDRVIYEGTDYEEPLPGWAEKKFTITWKDKKWGTEDETQDSILAIYKVPYGTMADWNSSSPVREPNDDYTYTFTGWTPALAAVTSDVTYTATYQENPIKYTIIFKNDGGTEIERHLLARNEFPVCEDLPTRTGFILQWEPQLAAVMGDQTYKATWIPDAPESYAITFYDHNGTMLKPLEGEEPYMVDVDDIPEAPENPDGKEPSIEYNYVFDHWSPAIEPVSPTSAKIYTAVYRQIPRTYMISFYDETGEIKIGEQILAYGETPVAPEVTKADPDPGMRYTYVWQNMDDASKNIETVTGDANYKPVFDGEPMIFSITLKSNPSGACTFTGAGSYKYNEEVEISLNVKDEDYSFTGWSDGVVTATRTMTVTKDTVLVANFNYEAGVTINWKNEDGSNDLVAPVKQKVGASTTYLGEIPTKEADAEFTYTFYGWSTQVGTEENEWNYGTIYKNGMTPKAADGGATYYAYFTETLNQYTVTLRNAIPGACEFRGAGVRTYGTTVNIVATPNGDYEFVKWQETGSTEADFDLVVTGDITLTAIVKEKEKPAPGDLELGINATETVSPATNYTDVVITSDGISASSQIINANNITLYGNADFVLDQAMTAGVWYSVAVPWRVEGNGGIFLGGSSTPAVLGKDIEIISYDGAVRAAKGKVDACWVWMKRSENQILEPGRAYMFLIRHGAVSSVTFRKKALEPILTTGTSVQQYSSQTGDEKDANWNAIANPSLFHAYINAGANDSEYGINRGQVYDAEHECYTAYNMGNYKLVVGQPIYVQAAAAKSIVANPSSYAAAPARRANAQIRPTNFELSLSANGTSLADKLTVRLNENKEENAYVIGQDLVKFGVSTKVAQMWIDRYNAKLCVNTVAPEEDATSFPMSLFAPKAGVYTIAIDREVATEDYNLYLTYNGQAIWNLSDGAYAANLNKGTDANYGLRISLKAPQVTTGVDEAIVDAQGETRKVLINNQVFIIRGNNVYSIDGQLIR